MKPVLDACCGPRMFWFNKQDERAVFCDIRKEIRNTVKRNPIVVNPDVFSDYREIKFPDESFYHVVFDPPHLQNICKNSNIAFSYGLLENTWESDLKKGFKECFRVLKPYGTLIFKWCETQIPLKEVLKLTNNKPLYGHISGKRSRTHWVAFIKEPHKNAHTR